MSRKRYWTLIILPVFLFFMFQPQVSRAAVVGLKLYGGYNYLGGGDINAGLKGFLESYLDEGQMFGLTYQGDYMPIHGGLNFGVDLIINFTSFLGVGIGTEMIQAKKLTEIHYSVPWGDVELSVEPDVTVFPVRAGLYFSIPIGSLISLSLNGGAEYYLANFKYTFREEGQNYWRQSDSDLDSRGDIGLFGSAGIELKVHKNISFILEGRGRLGKVEGFTGNRKFEDTHNPAVNETVDLYYMEVEVPSLGWYPTLALSNMPFPDSPNIRNSRAARLDLDGFSAVAGLIVRF